MATITEQDLDQTIPQDELLALPAEAVAPGALSALWAKRAGIVERRNADELALEENPEYTGPRHLTRTPDKKSAAERAAMLHEQFLRTMEDIRERNDRLLEKIAVQEQICRLRLREIDNRAITLHDGRKAYVGTRGDYRDGQGAVLAGPAAEEAERLHRLNPNASTWAEKSDAENQYQELKRLKDKAQKLHDDAAEDGKGLSPEQLEERRKNHEERLSGYEKEFHDGYEGRTASLSPREQVTDETYGGSDYMAAYAAPAATRTPSYAGRLDGAQPSAALRKEFAPAAAGQGTETADGKAIPQPAPGASANNQPLSR